MNSNCEIGEIQELTSPLLDDKAFTPDQNKFAQIKPHSSLRDLYFAQNRALSG